MKSAKPTGSAKAPANAAWKPAKYDILDIASIQALARGKASSDQQVRALTWVIEEVCKTYDLSYRPDSERETAFAEGKRFVGLTLVKATKLNTELLRKSNG